MLALLLAPLALGWDPDESLELPPVQACVLPTEADLAGDEDLVDSGLSPHAVAAVLDDFSPMLQRCVPTETAPRGLLEVDLTVSCTGRVAWVEVVDDGGLDSALVGCVQRTLRYTPFPAHGMDEGLQVTWPVRFSYAR